MLFIHSDSRRWEPFSNRFLFFCPGATYVWPIPSTGLLIFIVFCLAGLLSTMTRQRGDAGGVRPLMNLVPFDRRHYFLSSYSLISLYGRRERRVTTQIEKKEMNGCCCLSLHSSFAPASRPTVWFYIYILYVCVRLNWSIGSGSLLFPSSRGVWGEREGRSGGYE